MELLKIMSKPILNNVEINTSAETVQLEQIRNFVSNNAILAGFEDSQAQKIALAVDEACTNLIAHAYKYDNSHNIKVKIESDKNEFVIKILDDGIPFDPMKISSPNMVNYFKEYRHGGLGIHIMKLVMDEIDYIPAKNSNKYNTLVLKKYI